MDEERSGKKREPGRARVEGYGLAVLAAVCWACGGLAGKWVFNHPGPGVTPAALAAARVSLAFVILLAGMAVFRRREVGAPLRQVPFLAAFGVFGLALVNFTYFSAIQATNAPTAILLEYLAPVLVLIVASLFMGVRPTWRLPAGVALSIAGVALVAGAASGTLRVSTAGLAWGLAAAACFAGYTLMGRRAADVGLPSWTTLLYGLGAASAFWLLVLGPAPIALLLADPVRAAVVAGMAVLGTIVPFWAYLRAIELVGPTEASVTATLEPVVAAAVGALMPGLGATLGWDQLLGGAFVLAAVLLVQLGPGGRTAAAAPTGPGGA